MNKLTDKQQAFCLEYIKNGFDPTAAYIKIYNVKESVAPASATRLLKNVKIKDQIQKHKEKLAERVMITKEELIQDLVDIKELHKKGKAMSGGVAIKALETIAKLLGYNAVEKSETTISFKAQFPEI